jgi:nitrogen fixation NifU-like protein
MAGGNKWDVKILFLGKFWFIFQRSFALWFQKKKKKQSAIKSPLLSFSLCYYTNQWLKFVYICFINHYIYNSTLTTNQLKIPIKKPQMDILEIIYQKLIPIDTFSHLALNPIIRPLLVLFSDRINLLPENSTKMNRTTNQKSSQKTKKVSPNKTNKAIKTPKRKLNTKAKPTTSSKISPITTTKRNYHPNVIDHYEKPRNVGSLDAKSDEVGTGLVGAPACGDVMKLQVKIKDGIVEDVKFRTFGCGSAIASSSYATTWLKGKTIEEALSIKNTDIASHLSLPPVKMHCSMLAEDAVKAAIQNYQSKQTVKQQQDAI